MASCQPLTPDIEELFKDSRSGVQQHQQQQQQHNNKRSINMSSKEKMRMRSVSDANVVALCTCQQSRDFPYCDGTHNVFNKATNSNMQPLYLAIVEGKCEDCASKTQRNDRLSHSMDHQSSSSSSTTTERRGCTITLSDSTTKLNTSSATCASKCKCTTNKLSASSPDIYPLADSQTISSSPPSSSSSSLHTTKTPTPTPEITQTTPVTTTPTPIQHTSNPPPSTTSTPSTNTCNITKEKVDTASTKVKYTPSSIKSPINQKNIITRAEVAEHATQDDLWMIIYGNVYNITDYVQYHPGGTRALVKFAGKDGTDNVHYHSSKMLEILNQHYFIGKLPKSEGGGGGGCIIS